MFYAHAQKQTNKHNSLSLSLSHCLATFGPPPLSLDNLILMLFPDSLLKEQLLLQLFLVLLLLFLSIAHLRQHNSVNTAFSFFFLLHIMTLPLSSVCLS